MTGTTAAAAELSHDIGPNGRFALRMPAGTVSIQAVDGGTARVRDLSGAPLADRFHVTTGDGSLELVARSRFNVTVQIGKHAFGGDASAELVVELPRATAIALETASADVSVAGITAPGRYRTTSGDLILQDVAGNLEIEGVSADVRVEAVAPIELGGRTISGDVAIRAPRLRRLELTTTSGDVKVDADLAGDGPFSLKSISGDVTLVSRGGLQVDAQTVTGDLHSDLESRSQSSPGRKTLSIGRGGPTLAFKSVSGDLRVVEPRDAAAISEVGASAGTGGAQGGEAKAAPAELPAFAAGDRDGSADSSDVDHARLEILKALERGDIDVETATERLMVVEG